jgi:RNA polymerase sigma-B factor
MGPTSTTLPRHDADRDHTVLLPGIGSTNLLPRRIVRHPVAAADQLHAKKHDDLIASHMAMAARIASTFAGRGQDIDDLTQVAMLELVRAVGRFDPSRGVTFAQYAFPCLIGALKKHFRDSGWGLHVPRRMQELHLQTRSAIPALTQLLGRDPTVTDLAVHLHLSEKDTRDGMALHLAYKTRSLNVPAREGEDGELGDLIGGLDDHLEGVPDRHTLAKHVAALPARERSILHLRFNEDLCQREIAERLGISQMHVSRLLSRCLNILRARILDRN